MVYGYIRVSTDKQTVENQRYEIENYCVDRKICVDKWIEETVSGSISLDRRTLGRLLKKVSHDDIIICSELSRLGRNLFMIMDVKDDFDFQKDMAKLATLPRQAEWEAYVSQFQGCSANARSDEKWQLMERIF